MSGKKSAWRSPWFIAWIGLLLAFVIANGIMIFLATDRSPSLVVEDFYERGQDYERNMLKRLARDPGWNMKIMAPEFIDIAKPALFRFNVTDKAGNPITPDSVTLYAYRPSDADEDFALPMQQVAPGQYQVVASFPLLGVWEILVSVKNGEDEYNTPYDFSAGVR